MGQWSGLTSVVLTTSRYSKQHSDQQYRRDFKKNIQLRTNGYRDQQSVISSKEFRDVDRLVSST